MCHNVALKVKNSLLLLLVILLFHFFPYISKNTRWTLERAKENSRKYLMIGLTSQWSTTVRVLEILLPDLLNGLSTLMLEETEKGWFREITLLLVFN